MSWIKWTTGLARKPEVGVMAALLSLDRFAVAGRLMEFWEWCDENVPEEAITGAGSAAIALSPDRDDNERFIDSVVGLAGFASALSHVGWLSHRTSGVEIPNFARHNGLTAKTRARNSLNQSSRRRRTPRPESVAEVSPPPGDKTVTRGEERREEEIPPQPPGGGEGVGFTPKPKKPRRPHAPCPGFGEFWAAWPKKVAREDAARAWDKLCPDGALRAVILAAVESWKTAEPWLKDGGQFVPHAATWLNGRRWQDALPAPAAANGSQAVSRQELDERVRHQREAEAARRRPPPESDQDTLFGGPMP